MGIDGVGSKSNSEINPTNDEPIGSVAAGPKPPPLEESNQSTVEAHPGDAWGSESATHPHAAAEAAQSPAEVQQLQSESAKALRDFRSAMQPAVAEVAKRKSDPTAVFSGLSQKDLRESDFVKALQTPQVRSALGKMSEGTLNAELQAMAQKAWPQLSPDEAREVGLQLAKQVREHAKYEAAFGMKSQAVSQMRSTSAELAELARDPKRLQALTQQLRSMPRDQELALRAKLGIDDPQELIHLDARTLGERIGARAKVLDHAARELDQAGANRVFLVMADHDVSAAYASKAGIMPGSVAANELASARAQGKTDQADLEKLKLACTVAASFATGGLGAAGIAGLGTAAVGSAAMSAGGLHEKYTAIEKAKAGESSGTMKPGAVENAEHHFHVAAGAAAFEVAAGGAIANGLSHPLGHVVSHGVAHGIAHAAVTGGVIAVEHQVAAEHE